MKITHLIAICFLFALLLSACDTKSEHPPEVNEVLQEYSFMDSSDFSSEYINLDDFDELYVALSDYYTLVENAYAKSDKKSLSTFSLSEDEMTQFKNRIDELTELPNDILSSSNTAMNNALLKLELAEQVLRVNVQLAEYKILVAGGVEENKQWISNLRSALDAAYSSYRIGNE